MSLDVTRFMAQQQALARQQHQAGHQADVLTIDHSSPPSPHLGGISPRTLIERARSRSRRGSLASVASSSAVFMSPELAALHRERERRGEISGPGTGAATARDRDDASGSPDRPGTAGGGGSRKSSPTRPPQAPLMVASNAGLLSNIDESPRSVSECTPHHLPLLSPCVGW